VDRTETQKQLEKLQTELGEFEAKDLECGDGQDCLAIIISKLFNLYLATAFANPGVAFGGLERVISWFRGQAIESLAGGNDD